VGFLSFYYIYDYVYVKMPTNRVTNVSPGKLLTNLLITYAITLYGVHYRKLVGNTRHNKTYYLLREMVNSMDQQNIVSLEFALQHKKIMGSISQLSMELNQLEILTLSENVNNLSTQIEHIVQRNILKYIPTSDRIMDIVKPRMSKRRLSQDIIPMVSRDLNTLIQRITGTYATLHINHEGTSTLNQAPTKSYEIVVHQPTSIEIDDPSSNSVPFTRIETDKKTPTNSIIDPPLRNSNKVFTLKVPQPQKYKHNKSIESAYKPTSISKPFIPHQLPIIDNSQKVERIPNTSGHFFLQKTNHKFNIAEMEDNHPSIHDFTKDSTEISVKKFESICADGCNLIQADGENTKRGIITITRENNLKFKWQSHAVFIIGQRYFTHYLPTIRNSQRLPLLVWNFHFGIKDFQFYYHDIQLIRALVKNNEIICKISADSSEINNIQSDFNSLP
jgi:hypothetical protein